MVATVASRGEAGGLVAHTPSKAQARKQPVPDGYEWQVIRHLAQSRIPATSTTIARLTRVPTERVAKMMVDAEKWGWFRQTDAGWQGRL